MDNYSSSHVKFLTNWFVASTKFWVDDGIVVVAAEDDATVSLITGAANGKLFRSDARHLAARRV